MPLPPFDHLLDAHGRDVHRFLVAMVGPQEAADCFQESVLAALRAYPRLRDDQNLRGWLFTIAHHKALDHHRGRTRRPVADQPVPECPGAGPGPDDGPWVEDGLWDAVLALPGGQRAAVVQRFVLDRPYAEIALVLGCREDAARQRVRAGLATLRSSLAAAEGAADAAVTRAQPGTEETRP